MIKDLHESWFKVDDSIKHPLKYFCLWSFHFCKICETISVFWISQAKRLFERICPGEDFLPAAPEPEDIVFEDHSKDNPGEHKEVMSRHKGTK